MPKIRAATLVEHRRLQRDALLAAARELLAEGGMEALTFPNLAARTGLARSSVYEYFKSRAGVVEELCAVDFPAWAVDVAEAVAAQPTPVARVEAYVRAQLTLAGDPRHRAIAAISAMELDDAARERIRAAHGQLAGPIVTALTELGHPSPALAASLLQGTVEAAAKRLELGDAVEEPDVVIDAAVALVLDGVSGSSRA
ncbi:TetR/AcrR family transcriptional regulator [Streptacidiphilus fuscans]|uniref:TetR family transcriptional regulator n=1 Tax=Streptacidiphilus fuscans TaxID=2789292 RepID=A0A931AYY1_9ACTN|nr:TetR family transcriptional regulator [Streptacidiphilus fuscans]MBF9067286.1 TetR family transcriptional regulator [Streptacidiphilus fuscans]